MLFKHNLFNIVVVVSSFIMTVLAANNYPELFQQNLDINILNLIARSGNLMARGLDGFMICVATYQTETNLNLNKFKTNYEACCTKADNERSQVDEKSLSSRQSLANRTEMSCKALGQCKDGASVEKIFECYADGGNENAKVWHDISSDASSDKADYKQRIDNIQGNENRCTSQTEREYQDDNIAAYEKLDNCIKGRVEETSSTTTSTSSPTTGPEPTTTTEQTTTERKETNTTENSDEDN